MLKAIKLITKSLLLFVLILGTSGVLFVNFVDPNRFKTIITQEVSKTIDKEVTVDGSIHWTFYPWLGLALEEVKIKNPSGFLEPFLATAQKLQLNIATLPLLKGKIHVGHIKIQKLNADLITTANGQSNWQATKNTKPSSNTENSSLNVEKMHVSSISIEDGRIHWKNIPKKQEFLITALQFSSQYFAFNKFFPVNTRFSFEQAGFSANIILKIKMLLPEFVNSQQMMNQLQANGDIELTQVKVDQLRINQIQSGLNIQKGKIVLSPFKAELYQGTATGSIGSDMNTLSIQQSIKQLNLGALLQDMKKERSIEGTLNLDTKLSGSGKNLNGYLNFAIRNGELKGVNIPQAVGLVTALIHQKMPIKSSRDTHFSSFTGTMNVNNGVLTTHDLLLNATSFRITGAGTLNLHTKAILYDLKVTLLDSGLGSSVAKLQQALGGGIPVVVTGTYDNYKVQPDYSAVTAVTATMLLQETGGEVVPAVKKVGDSVGQGVRDVGKAIKDIFH